MSRDLLLHAAQMTTKSSAAGLGQDRDPHPHSVCCNGAIRVNHAAVADDADETLGLLDAWAYRGQGAWWCVQVGGVRHGTFPRC
jgi:hypothetical protein